MSGSTRVETSPFTGLFRLLGYALLGGTAFVVVVVLSSLLHGDLARVWAEQLRRTREKNR